MADFDLTSFGSNIAGGGGLLTAAVGAFGLPTCVLDISEAVLFLLPTPILTVIHDVTASIQAEIDKEIKKIWKEIVDFFGIEEYFTEEGLKKLRVKWALTDWDPQLPIKIAALIQFAGQIYSFIETAKEFIEEVKECLEAVKNALSSPSNTSIESYTGQRIAGSVALANARLEQLDALNDKVISIQTAIEAELDLRAQDPDREPGINPALADRFPGFKIAKPAEDEELIRLVYGPPLSKDGQFILSNDGLYYDSRSDEGITPILIQLRDRKNSIDLAERWKFNFDPNIGGRGEEINRKTYDKWVNSIFDPSVIDDSAAMREEYNADSLLKTLMGQRDKRMQDIKTQIEDLIASGTSQSIINNFKEALLSEVTQLNTKVDRRKKQIEIAVKAPNIFGGETAFPRGQVPINDFGYLSKYNLSLALVDQQALVLEADSVSGIVLPLSGKFVQSKVRGREQTMLNHLIFPDLGFDAIMTDGLKASDASANQVNMSEVVNTDGLFALYNFLNSDCVMPSATVANLNNCITSTEEGNAFLISKSSKDFFTDLGLAAPYFKGICENASGPAPLIGASALGSFVKLPDSKEFQDWTYGKYGFGFETWIHMPTLEDSDIGWKDNGVSSLYRLILANENVGIRTGAVRDEDYNLVPFTQNSDYTRGLIFGFTTDVRWTEKSLPSNDFSLQNPSVGYGLVLAPTVSYDASSATFFSNPECDTTNGYLGMFVSSTKTTASGKSLADLVHEYMLLSLSVDYRANSVSIYLDGEVLETSSLTDVFGVDRYRSLNIPSFKQNNSFNYNTTSVGPLAPRSLQSGPKLGNFFTPWILGGGYTDGYKNGGFMGGEYGGLISGLRGFLGSVKFYSKTLNTVGINQTYKHQERLFKQLKWRRPVIIAIGQSNIAGDLIDLSSVGQVEYTQPIDGAKIWDPFTTDLGGNEYEGSWVTLDANQKNNRTRYVATQNDTPPIPGRATGNPKICPVVAFMKHVVDDIRISSSIKTDAYVVKNAYGGTWMYDFSRLLLPGLPSGLSWTFSAGANPITTVDDTVPHYHKYYELNRDITNALAAVPEPYEVKAVIMMQGENEASVYPGTMRFSAFSSVVADGWLTDFEVLYERVQDQLKGIQGITQDTPWIITQAQKELPAYGQYILSPDGPEPVSFIFTDEVRAQQNEAANSESLNVSLIDVDNLSFITEPYAGFDRIYYLTGIHFDAPSLITIGKKLFNKYKEIIG